MASAISGQFRVRPMFAWYDAWVGIFYDRPKRRLYVFPLPCFGLRIELRAPLAQSSEGCAPSLLPQEPGTGHEAKSAKERPRDRAYERRLKVQGGHSRKCPICWGRRDR